ncbi:histidine phosphatase superfamily [Gamsiella multidivaricata]|uniref:histidine phosphatase superfamily n=1 Tax=Gamsiella multidivaricata TaxID=101098 RepID=UPI00221FACBE|nr:histidine phosphatase superfamily [Gamsiella multidivaricata]KAI7832311.1 histidine phosphatase superfamily [Gamsiella multidivaricata]
MVVQTCMRHPRPSYRPWFDLALPCLALVAMIALLSPTVHGQAMSLESEAQNDGLDVPLVRPMSAPSSSKHSIGLEADMVDRTEQLIYAQSWKTISSVSLHKDESNSTAESRPLLPLNWIRRHLGTKSPYPHQDRPVGPLTDTPAGYELAQLHLICRHGTRYPSSSNAIAFQTLAEKLERVVVPGLEWLRSWSSEKLYPVTKGNLLSAKGDSDLYQIGSRFAIRYKDFLDRYPYDANTYEFQSSSKSRCSQSAYGFSVGILQGRHVNDPGAEGQMPPVQPVDIFTLPMGLDKEMAMKYACPRWLESVRDGPNVLREARSFQEKFLPDLAKQLSTMLNPKDGPNIVNITVKDVGTIYGICGFEVATYDNDRTWCQLLHRGTMGASSDNLGSSKSNFLKLEINSDLRDYYTHGPGVPFNRHLGCMLGTSLVNSIEMALDPNADNIAANRKGDDDDEGNGLFRGLFKFGHSETILFFSSFLGLYDRNGIPLKGDMTAEEYEKREFRSSKISPFAANMAFEVYRPKPNSTSGKRRLAYDDGSSYPPMKSDTPRGLVRLLVNELPSVIPGCGSDYFCEWATVKEIFQRAGAGCNFDGCCTSLDPSAGPDAISWKMFGAVEAANPAPVCLTVEPVV